MKKSIEVLALDRNNYVVRVPTTFSYESADPYAIAIKFHVPPDAEKGVTWLVDRRTLLHGLTNEAGEGDVKVHPSVDAVGGRRICLHLSSPRGSLSCSVVAEEVRLFLVESFAVVPIGKEDEHLDTDAMVESLLNGSV